MRGFLVRAPDALAVFLKQIDDAEGERIIRADDGEFDFLFLREREELGQIFGGDINAFDRLPGLLKSLLLNSRVAGRAPHLRDVGRLREFPNERVLASAGTNDENFHKGVRRLRRWREGKTGKNPTRQEI